jgi:hypothetical protein
MTVLVRFAIHFVDAGTVIFGCDAVKAWVLLAGSP